MADIENNQVAEQPAQPAGPAHNEAVRGRGRPPKRNGVPNGRGGVGGGRGRAPRAPGGNPPGGRGVGPAPPGPINGPVVAPNVPPVVPPVVVSVKKFGYVNTSNSWSPVAAPGSATSEYLKKIGIIARAPGDGNFNDTNNHPNQAAERSVATARTLGLIYSKGHHKVTTVYGSERDERINHFCNSQVQQGHMRLELTRYTPPITSKDFTRNPTTITFAEAVQDAQTLLLVDIYSTDMLVDGKWSTKAAAIMLNAMRDPFGGNRIVWVGRCFYGNGGLVAHEGGWYRDDAGQIVYRSGEDEPHEYRHDPCDWMWLNSQANVTVHGQNAILSWGVVKVVGTFKIVAFNCTVGNIVDCHPSIPLYPFDDFFVEVNCPSDSWFVQRSLSLVPYLPGFLVRKFPFTVKRKMLRSLYQAGTQESIHRRFNQNNFTRISAVIIAAQSSNADVVKYLSLFKQFRLRRELTAITWGIYTDDLTERRHALRVTEAVSGADMFDVNERQANIGASPSPNSVSYANLGYGIAGIATALLCYRKREILLSLLNTPIHVYNFIKSLLMKRVSSNFAAASLIVRWPYQLILPTVLSNDESIHLTQRVVGGYITDGLVTPLFEETLKTVLSSVSSALSLPVSLAHMFGPFEFYQYCKIFPLLGEMFPNSRIWHLVLMRMAPLIMHYFTARMSFRQAVVVHSLYNLFGTKLVMLFLVYVLRIRELVPRPILIGKIRTLNWKEMAFIMTAIGFLALLIHRRRSSVSKTSEYEIWKNRFYGKPVGSEPVYEDSRSFTCKILDPRVPESVSDMGTPLIDEADKVCLLASGSVVAHRQLFSHTYFVVTGRFPPPRDKSPTFFWHVLPTNAPGFVPKPCAQNMRVALENRILTSPVKDPAEQRTAWKEAFDEFGTPLLEHCYDPEMIMDTWDTLVIEWLGHFRDSKKRKMYTEVVRQIRVDDPKFLAIPATTDLFMKHDEMLMQQKDGKYVLKPRIIANVAPTVQARLGPYVYKCQKRLAAKWSIDTPAFRVESDDPEVPVTYFHIVYAGMLTDAELSEWLRRVFDHFYVAKDALGYCIIGSGDDGVTVECRYGVFRIFETDMRACDRNNGFGPHLAQYRIMHELGMPPWVGASLFKLIKNCYTTRLHKDEGDQPRLLIDRSGGPMRDTGNSDTTLGNTIVVASAWYLNIRAMQHNPQAWRDFSGEMPQQVIIDSFQHLGFDVKLIVTDDWRRVTFLKGMWYDVDDRMCWGPLPSRFDKIGKSMKNPVTMYSEPNEPKLDQFTASDMFARDVASSYATFLPVPIIRAFVQRYKNPTKHHRLAELSEHSIMASGSLKHLSLSRHACEAVCDRYDLSYEDILRAEEMILTSEALTWLHDPVFLRMATVDYA